MAKMMTQTAVMKKMRNNFICQILYYRSVVEITQSSVVVLMRSFVALHSSIQIPYKHYFKDIDCPPCN